MIFSLYLASNNATQSPTTTNCSWLVNWEDLFRIVPKEYQKCRVKYHFVSQTYESSSGISATSRTGYLQANFVSQSQGGVGTGGVILGLISPQAIIQYSTANGVLDYQLIKYDCSTLATKGVEITRPVGTGQFNLQLMTYSSSTPSSSGYDQEYSILLEFDFDEE